MKKKSDDQEEVLYEISATNQRMINYRAYKMSSKEKMLYFIAAFLVGAVVGYLFYGGIGKDDYGNPRLITYIIDITVMLIVGLITAKVYLPIRKKQIIVSRKKKLRKQFIDLLDSLSSSISSGKNVPSAFFAAREDLLVQYSEDAYIMQEVDNIISGIQNNIDVGQILLNFGERSGIRDIKTFGRVFDLSYEKGANLKDVVRNCHEIISGKCEIEAEIETKVASNKNEQNIMLVMPVIFVAIIKLSGSSFANDFTTPSGILSTTIAIVAFIAAYIIGKKILNIEV